MTLDLLRRHIGARRIEYVLARDCGLRLPRPAGHSTWVRLCLLLMACSPQGEPCEHHFASKDGLTGEFTSPGYPISYPIHTNCRFFFRGTVDERIRITWIDFDLEEGTKAGCLFDYVDIFTIDIDNMKHLENRLCGKRIPEPVVSLHLTMELNFKSDYTGGNHKGFLGRFEFIDERWQPFPPSSPECGLDYYPAGIGGGVITSAHFPEPYPPNMECTWMIRVEEDRKILINFVDLDLGQSVSCGDTFVKIYNGFASAEGAPAEQVCGQLYFYNRGVKEFKSKTFRVVIRFKSAKNELQSRGFRLAWTAVKLPKIIEDQNGNYIEEPCREFHCKGGEYCIDTSGLLCNPLPRYCIAKSLCCNGVPNCGVYDHSDEDGCFKKIILIIVATGAPILGISAIVITIYICHRRHVFKKSASQEQALTMTLQKLDRSPTSSKRSNEEKSNNSVMNSDYQQRVPRSPHNNYYGAPIYRSPSNHGGYYQPSPHTLRMPPGRIPAYHMVVNTDSDDSHSVHATV